MRSIFVVAILAAFAACYFRSSYDDYQPFRYKEYGDAKKNTVVIIPGINGATAFFNDVVPQLTLHCHVIVYHLPIIRRSDDVENYTFEYLATDLMSVLNELNVTNASMIGECFGAVVAKYFTILYPTYVSRLVLLSPLARMSLPPETEWKIKYILPMLTEIGRLFPSISQQIFALVHVRNVMRAGDPQYVRDLFVKETSYAHFYSVMRRMLIISRLDIVNEVSAITQPTLLVYGIDDDFSKFTSTELKSTIKNSKVKTFPGGRYPHVTAPTEFSCMCIAFIGTSVSNVHTPKVVNTFPVEHPAQLLFA